MASASCILTSRYFPETSVRGFQSSSVEIFFNLSITCALFLLPNIEELKAKVGIKKTIADYGVKEEDFLATLDEMTEAAFDDQCTGANPRYPLMSEMKAMYLKAYYGK